MHSLHLFVDFHLLLLRRPQRNPPPLSQAVVSPISFSETRELPYPMVSTSPPFLTGIFDITLAYAVDGKGTGSCLINSIHLLL